MQRIAIVDPNEATRESLRGFLLSVDFVWLEAECARYEYFFDVIHASKDSMPDLAIVHLDSDKQRALQMIGEISVKYPKLQILTISKDHQALLLSLQRGAKYFLTDPVVLEDLLSALQRSVGESASNNGDSGSISQGSGGFARQITQSSVTAILGSRGGVGTTSLAVNLAATLAATDSENKVALIDLDLAMGDADIAIEVDGMDNISIADLARNIERLDMNFLKRALVKHAPTGLSILRHPLEIQDMAVIHESHVERIVNLLKISYSHLILDLSKSLLPTDLMGLRLADTILLVAQLELSSLRNVVRLMHLLNNTQENLGDRVKVIVNRVGSEAVEEGISLKKAEEVIGQAFHWQIPNDSKAVMAARVAGQPLVKANPKCRAQQSIYGLAQSLSGKPMAVGTDTKKSPWSLFGKR